MPAFIVAYVAAALVFFTLDYLWLSRIAAGFYRAEIGHLMSERPNFAVAGLFYLFYVGGIVHFAVMPTLSGNGWTGGTWVAALVSGALLGFIAYGTYDMTNLATLRGWSLPMSLVDIAWGTALTAAAALAGYLAAARFAA